MTLVSGTRLGPYEVLEPLGAGGMGEVYKARDTRLDRTVAIKVLLQRLAANAEARQRFEREARAVSSLNHPNICVLHDIGHQDSIDFLVMEYLEGETLAARLTKGPLPLPHALEYAIQIAGALAAAHRRGISHRDLKPGNVMLTKSGAKLLDFGLAKWRAPGVGPAGAGASVLSTVSEGLTERGAILGTLQYMAPEQLEGKEADARSDIFAFGAVHYEMVTGRKAFEGKSRASLIAAILEHDPPPISTLQPLTPPALDRVVKKCLTKDPDERWQTAQDLASELEWIAESGSQLGTSLTLPASAIRVPLRRTNRERFARGAAAFAALAALAVTVIHFRETPPREPVMRFQVAPPEKVSFRDYDMPLISPDGERLAFAGRIANRGGQQDHLWIRPLNSFEAQMVSGSDDAYLPFWSPDGRSLAFFAGGSLKRVDLAGGSPVVLCAVGNARGGAWNSRGTIVFARDNTEPLYQVSTAGGEPKPVTALDASGKEAGGHRYPVFLPDGRHFLYLALGTPSGVNLGTLDSKESRRLFNSDSNVQFAAPDQLLFVRDGALMAQRFDTRKVELLGDPALVARQLSTMASFFLANFSVSQNGVLAYRTGAASFTPTRLVWLDRTGNELGTVGEPGDYSNPALSPDEKRLAVGRREPGRGTRDIWVFDLTRGASSRLTFHPADHTVATWSPDGKWIAFASDRKGQRNLYRKLASGVGDEEVLAESEERKNTEYWSRDGRTIIVNYIPKGRQGPDVGAVSMNGDRKLIPVLAGPYSKDQAQLSPNGRWLAYRSNESGRTEVYVQSFPPSGGKWQISTFGGSEPQWRRDGKELFYMDGNKLMAVDVKTDLASFEGGIPKQLFEARISGVQGRNRYEPATNGQRFLIIGMNEKISTGPINIVLNWQAGLRR